MSNSFELTFRQKLIRVSCSAAVCGLSISFLLGEAVDNGAKSLHQWVVDPSILPANYLPLRPLYSALDQLENPQWTKQLVAINDVGNSMSSPVEQSIYIEPALVTVSAAPVSASKSHVNAAKRKRETELPAAELDKVLVSIQEAEKKVSDSVSKTPAKIIIKNLAAKSPANTPEKASTPQVVAALTADHDTNKSGRIIEVSAASSERPWSIQGKIWGATAQSLGAGHFEVGLFSKIDPEGKPVGYPMPQQILSAGQSSFKFEVPARIDHGYLFAEFVAAKTGKRTLVSSPVNPWDRSNHRLADLYFHSEDEIKAVAAAPATLRDIVKDEWKIQGNVGTMFATTALPQSDVVVKVRGRKEAVRTDSKGNFTLTLPRLNGTLFLEVLKAGYHPLIVNVTAGDEHPLKMQIASQHALDQIAQRLGFGHSASEGVFIGQAQTPDGVGIRGFTASLSLKADGPIFFDEEGNPSREMKATGGNGRFMFINIEAGAGYLDASINGEAIAPVQISVVDGGELSKRTLIPVSGSLHGRIFNPVAQSGTMQPISSARVRVDGASDWVTSDAYGAFSIGPMKWIKGEKVALEMSAEKFNNHRYMVNAEPDSSAISLYAFPASYIIHLARSMDVDVDPYAGLVIGKVNGPSLRIDALADQATVNNAKDFYFDSKGRLRPSHEMTDPRFGTYIIFNVPKGRALLQGNDSSGTLRYSSAVFSSPNSINVEME